MGNSQSVDGRAPIHIFASSKAWIEGNATRQLEEVAKLPGVTSVAAMPDLHPGKYGPVGCAILADAVHPAFVGADIGCGMGLFQLGIAARRIRIDRAADRMRVLGSAFDGDPAPYLRGVGFAPTGHDAALGSIGGGNHFCELQAIEQIVDADAAAAAGLDVDAAFLLVHSGSRGFGYAILESVLADGLVALAPTSAAGASYLAEHDRAVGWAALNRRMIAARAADALWADVRCIVDLAHNLAEVTPRGVLHRKGAAASDRGLVPVPGSRGTLSYLVAPSGAARPETLASIAHGAGRKLDRRSMHGRVGTNRSELEQLARNRFGGVVVCEDRNMLIEEAPDAYKAIEHVIDDLVAFDLARVVATFRPLVTFKSVREREERARSRHRDKGFVDKRDRILRDKEGGR
jgi:release factor H-coupled RctB family protein